MNPPPVDLIRVPAFLGQYYYKSFLIQYYKSFLGQYYKSFLSHYYYPLANEVAKGYSNAIVRPSFCPSFRNILVNTLESIFFNGF